MLTQERLKELLHYNHDTGVFTRLVQRPGCKAGAIAGTIQPDGYIVIRVDTKRFYAQKLAWLYFYGEWPKYKIDHRNGNTGDNRIKNLRDVTSSVNSQNMRKPMRNNKSGFLGVSWSSSSRKWFARIRVNEISVHLGYFSDAESAHEAYICAKRIMHPGCTI